MRISIFLLIIFFSNCFHLFADSQKDFKDLIINTYNFSPSQLTREQQQEKMPVLDAFFNTVKSDKRKYLPLLRKELTDYTNNPYFLFDGASLLFLEAKSKEDLQICADALGHVYLKDVSGDAYFYFSMDLAKNGCDIYPSIKNILDYPDFSAFIAEHSIRLGQDIVVMYLCLQMDERLYVDKLIKRLKSEDNINTAKTIVLALVNTITLETQNALIEYSNQTKNKELKEEILKYKYKNKSELPKKQINTNLDIDKLLNAFKNRDYVSDKELNNYIFDDLPYMVKKADYDKIKQVRKEVSYRISDEALDELSFLTYLLKLSFTSNE